MVVKDLFDIWDKNELTIILEKVLDIDRTEVFFELDRELSPGQEEKILAMVEKRKEGYPLQYLLGSWYFYDFYVKTEEGVLIPRPETELLVEEALRSTKKGARVLELGTGTGIISIALKKHRPDLSIQATDISEKALALAKENASLNQVHIDFSLGDLYQPVEGKFDLIISNPPYIPEGDREKLSKELSFEPDQALFAGADGLDIIRRIVKEGPNYLNDQGLVLLEIGHDQGEGLAGLFKDYGFHDIMIIKDYNNFDRIGKARLC